MNAKMKKHKWWFVGGGALLVIFFIYKNRSSSSGSAVATVMPAPVLGANLGANVPTSGASVDPMSLQDSTLQSMQGQLDQLSQAVGNMTPAIYITSTGSGSSAKSAPSTASTTPDQKTARSMVGPGSRGYAVTIIQRDLGITADGVYGPQTKIAIEDYQKARHLRVDGIVGPQTWGSISSGGLNGYKTPTSVKNYYSK